MTSRCLIRSRALDLRSDRRHHHPDCVVVAETIERQLRSGSTLTAALRDAARRHSQPWCRQVVRSLDRGSPLTAAIRAPLDHEMRQRRPDTDLVLTMQVLAMAAEVGGEPTRHVAALAETLRARRRAAADRLTQASTALASIRLLTWLPVACAIWMVVDDPGVRAVLIASPIGWACLTAGVVFNLLGRHWTNRLVRRL
jgi:Flp pilus assembly protein TadB